MAPGFVAFWVRLVRAIDHLLPFPFGSIVLAAFCSTQRSSSATGTSRIRPGRMRRRSGCTYLSNESSDMPIEAAASTLVNARRGSPSRTFETDNHERSKTSTRAEPSLGVLQQAQDGDV